MQYGARPTARAGLPADYGGSGGYGAAAGDWGTAAGGYGALAGGYGAAAGGFGAPAAGYGTVAASYGTTAGSYGTPPSWGTSAASSGALAAGYGASATGYGTSSVGYGTLTPGQSASPGPGVSSGHGNQKHHATSAVCAALDLLDDLEESEEEKETIPKALPPPSHWDPLADADVDSSDLMLSSASWNAARPPAQAAKATQDQGQQGEWDPFADPADDEPAEEVISAGTTREGAHLEALGVLPYAAGAAGGSQPVGDHASKPSAAAGSATRQQRRRSALEALMQSRNAEAPEPTSAPSGQDDLSDEEEDPVKAFWKSRTRRAPKVAQAIEEPEEEEETGRRAGHVTRSHSPPWERWPAEGSSSADRGTSTVGAAMRQIQFAEEEVATPSLTELLGRIDREQRQEDRTGGGSAASAPRQPVPRRLSPVATDHSLPVAPLKDLLAMIDRDEDREAGTAEIRRDFSMLGGVQDDTEVPAVGTLGSADNVGTFGPQGVVTKLLQRNDPEHLKLIQRMQAEAGMSEDHLEAWCPTRSRSNTSGSHSGQPRPPDAGSLHSRTGQHRSIGLWGGDHMSKRSPPSKPPANPFVPQASTHIGPRMAEVPRQRRTVDGKPSKPD